MKKPETIDEYLSGFPPPTQTILMQIREAVQKAAPRATEKISYGIPTFYLYGNLVHFAAFKNHIGFYALPSGNEAFREELAAYPMGKGSIQFPIDRPMPLALIEKIVRFRVAENTEKKNQKKK
ncbi:iron chaperone [Flavobacterium caeni]|uniref:Uncharacterized conserved protein YdhG, YjbR/CyaY-like superfamily, DUF1801 family n=1 Tax=Flavobacterium caeni TaxID=490189 RepID=A0A1G5IXW6_9FLAO|nr:DUF1801 domain-containing protein [Flavobacterium caeni]SCY80916.1 Uncharacterized conserved protein YdhG, YjbR/CyaY-like superfamily, DUF1801 family [Flavobacterium caeni]